MGKQTQPWQSTNSINHNYNSLTRLDCFITIPGHFAFYSSTLSLIISTVIFTGFQQSRQMTEVKWWCCYDDDDDDDAMLLHAGTCMFQNDCRIAASMGITEECGPTWTRTSCSCTGWLTFIGLLLLLFAHCSAEDQKKRSAGLSLYGRFLAFYQELEDWPRVKWLPECLFSHQPIIVFWFTTI